MIWVAWIFLRTSSWWRLWMRSATFFSEGADQKQKRNDEIEKEQAWQKLDHFFFALLCTDNAIATAWRCGFPACISRLMLVDTAFLLPDLTSGMTICLFA